MSNSKDLVLKELKQDLYEATNGFRFHKNKMEQFEVRMAALTLVIEKLEEPEHA